MIPEALLQKAKAKGTDEEYLEWLRTMPSATLGEYGEYVNGEGRNEAAHVRRVADGAGIAEKPPYSAIPLTAEEHNLQHQKGESVIAPKEWWEKQACIYLASWINGIKPPTEINQHKKVLIIKHAGIFTCLWLKAKKYFTSGGKAIKVTIEEVDTRSNKQNRAQFGVKYQHIAEFYESNPQAFAKDAVKYVFELKITPELVHKMMKVLCNDGDSTITGKREHCQYFERLDTYMMENHGIELRKPVKIGRAHV